jgi:hypothetical protein
MINPLQWYIVWRRPVGIWLAGAGLILQAAGHFRIALMGYESYVSLALSLFLFAASFFLLITRRVSAIICGTGFFIIGLYKATELFVHSSTVSLVYVLIWCAVSFAGIAGLLFNRRWFDERLVKFAGPDE